MLGHRAGRLPMPRLRPQGRNEGMDGHLLAAVVDDDRVFS